MLRHHPCISSVLTEQRPHQVIHTGTTLTLERAAFARTRTIDASWAICLELLMHAIGVAANTFSAPLLVHAMHAQATATMCSAAGLGLAAYTHDMLPHYRLVVFRLPCTHSVLSSQYLQCLPCWHLLPGPVKYRLRASALFTYANTLFAMRPKHTTISHTVRCVLVSPGDILRCEFVLSTTIIVFKHVATPRTYHNWTHLGVSTSHARCILILMLNYNR